MLLGFTLLTVALTWPVAPLFGQAINAFGDVVLQMTAMTWDAHALATAPGHIFDAPFFYPYAHSNAYSEHLIGETLAAWPIFWLTGGDPAPAHNFNFLLSFVLTGYATWLLVRDLTASRPAAWAAGIAYAFVGYRFVQSGHLNVLATEWFPFTLWALRRGLARRHGGYLAAAAAGCVAMGLFSVYFLYFLALLVGLYLVWWLGIARQPLPWRGAGLAGLGALAVLVPLNLPYLQVNAELGLQRSVYEVQSFAADPRFFLNVLPTNWLWATLFPRMIANGGEREMFPGLVITLLALVGLLAGVGGWGLGVGRRGSRSDERSFYLILALVAGVLTFGLYTRVPGIAGTVPLPYALLYDWVPGFTALRVPVRFDVLVNLALAVLGGYGLAALLRAWRRPAVWIWLPLLAGMCLEYVQVRDLSNHRAMRPPAPPANAWLAAHPGPVVELPMSDSPFGDVWTTYWATYDWQPRMNGAGSFMPPGTVATAQALAAFPDPAGIALLQGLEVRHVLVHLSQIPTATRRGLEARLAASPALTRVFAGGGDAIYALAPDPWAARVAAALPVGGYLWLSRGPYGAVPALETVAYALRFGRLPDARPLIPPDHVTGDLVLGYRPLPPLPYGRPADLALLPVGAAAGVAAGAAGATEPAAANGFAALYRRGAGLRATYDLTAPNAPAAPEGLALSPAGTRFDLGGSGAAAGGGTASLLIAAFAPGDVQAGDTQAALTPGLTRLAVPLPAGASGVDLRAAAGSAGAPRLLAVAVQDAGAPAPPGPVLLTDTLVLDLAPSTQDRAAGTFTTSWRVVPRHPDGGAFTLTLDVYQKPFGTHPNGHLGSWSLPLPAEAAGHGFTLTLDPLRKTATATRDGAATEVFAWRGPPTTGDFHATLDLLAGSRLLALHPVYDFTLDQGRVAGWSPAPGALLRLPFGD